MSALSKEQRTFFCPNNCLMLEVFDRPGINNAALFAARNKSIECPACKTKMVSEEQVKDMNKVRGNPMSTPTSGVINF